MFVNIEDFPLPPMIQITCVKELFSNIFQHRPDKTLNAKRHISELDDKNLQNHEVIQKKQKIEGTTPKEQKTTKKTEQQEEAKENSDNEVEGKKKNEDEVRKILEKFKGNLLVSIENEGQTFYKLRYFKNF